MQYVFTLPVEVVSGKPCYSRAEGLKISSNQTIASFCSKVFPDPVEAKVTVGTEGWDQLLHDGGLFRNPRWPGNSWDTVHSVCDDPVIEGRHGRGESR